MYTVSTIQYNIKSDINDMYNFLEFLDLDLFVALSATGKTARGRLRSFFLIPISHMLIIIDGNFGD